MTKKSSADDREWAYGELSVVVGCQGLYVFDDTALDALETAINAGSSVAVDVTSGTSGEKHFTFTGHPTALEKVSPNEDVSTFTTSISSSGAITYADV